MPIRKLSLTEYTDDGSDWSAKDVTEPTWEEVEKYIRRLDQSKYPSVCLMCGEDFEDGHLDIVGGNGIYSLAGATPIAGRKRFLELNHSATTEVDVWLSDQGFFTEETYVCYELPLVLQIAKHFLENGEFDPRVNWDEA